MGLIRAITSAVGTVAADQWREFFTCDSLSNDVLIAKGVMKTEGRGFFRRNKGTTDIITNGSVINVNEGQVALIVDNGKIVEFCAETGMFKWDSSSEPSLFGGDFFKGMVDSFKKIGYRFTFGGDAGAEQRVYYVNVKEIIGNKFGTTTPMAYDDPYYKTALYIRYFGQYSFKIVDPVHFFAAIAGNVTDTYTREDLVSTCTDEFMTALDTALAMCAADGTKFSQLPTKQREIARYMSKTLDDEWRAGRGLEVVSVALAKVTPDERSRERIEEFDSNMMHADPTAMTGGLAYAQMQAMKDAAKNSGGAMQGFMGVGMAANAMGGAATQSNLIDNAQRLKEEREQTAAKGGHTCPACGAHFEGKFCPECGEKYVAEDAWVCPTCGKECNGKFCADCGAKKPEGYTCACGYESDAPFKFCPECGKKYGK
ncbi:MAG: SPFH domain-containing protein [Clostridia bacterium]|nr:SPFH domain-containing protein [Clostridia bacterium]